MRNRIEIPFQVRIVDSLITRLQMRLYFLQGIMGRPFTAESVITIQKIRFEDRFQDQECSHLDHAIPNRRDAQRPQLSIRFLNPYTTYRLRLVCFLLQRALDFVQKSWDSAFALFNPLDGYA